MSGLRPVRVTGKGCIFAVRCFPERVPWEAGLLSGLLGSDVESPVESPVESTATQQHFQSCAGCTPRVGAGGPCCASGERSPPCCFGGSVSLGQGLPWEGLALGKVKGPVHARFSCFYRLSEVLSGLQEREIGDSVHSFRE